MKKGQIYILIAIVMSISIAGLANILYYTSLPVQREQVTLTSTKAVLNNIQNEVVYTIGINPSYVSDFYNFSKQYAAEKNINLTIS